MIVQLVEEAGEIVSEAALEQFGFQARFVRGNCFGVCDGDGVAKDEATLYRRRTEAAGDAGVEINVWVNGIIGRHIPADFVILGRGGQRAEGPGAKRAKEALGGEVFLVIGPAQSA